MIIDRIKIGNTDIAIEDQSRAPQVPSFMSNPERNKMRLRRLMQKEEQRTAEEEQPITNTVNMIAWSVVCVMIGWIIALI